MSIGKVVLVLLTLISGIFYFAADSKGATINYRITVTMQTPDGDVSGSTVRGVKLPSSAPLIKLPDAPAKVRSIGEAVVIDLGEKGFVFALIKDTSWMELLDSYPYHFEGDAYQDKIDFYQNIPKAQSKNIENLRLWPTMVWFKDISDPKSVKLVYSTVRENTPYGGAYIKQDMSEKTLGHGYAVKSVVIELTHADVTYGEIEKKLPWIWDYKDKRLDGNRFGTIKSQFPVANSLAAGAFTTGEYK